MSLWTSYKMRLRRRRLKLRSLRKMRELRRVVDRTGAIGKEDVLLFATVRNERDRLSFFLSYYRRLGISHFCFIDNGSDDGTGEYLAGQDDVSLWSTRASYARSPYRMDWLTGLLSRHGHGHWCLSVDVDEFLIYPFHDTRPLPALVDWLEASGARAFPAMQLDLYPKGPIQAADCGPGEDPLAAAPYFDGGNYLLSRNPDMGNLWIQGGPRARAFFADRPRKAPALNKIPLVKWDRRYAYASSTHMLLPRGLNQTYDRQGGETISGLLLHAKFLDEFHASASEEAARGEHYEDAAEYRAYLAAREENELLDLWTPHSQKFSDWRQLEQLGLMSKGNWT